MLDTFRKRDNVRDNVRTPTPHSPGSRPAINTGAHAASPAGGAARSDGPSFPCLSSRCAPHPRHSRMCSRGFSASRQG